MSSSSQLVVFTKIPGKAPVKTRLAELLEESIREKLAEAMIVDTLLAAGKSNFDNFAFCSEPRIEKSQLEAIADIHDANLEKFFGKDHRFSSQNGESFAERLDNCFSEHFSNCSIALIGSDCPMITPAALSAAKDFLDQGVSCLGPTPDGGLWLIGLSASALEKGFKISSIFGKDGLDITNFSAALKAEGHSFAFLPVLQDLDLPEDLVWTSSFFKMALEAENRPPFYPEFSMKTLGGISFKTERFTGDTRKTKISRN